MNPPLIGQAATSAKHRRANIMPAHLLESSAQMAGARSFWVRVRRKIGIRRRLKRLIFVTINNGLRAWVPITAPSAPLPTPTSLKKILLCNGAHLGDIVTVLAVIPALRANYPDAEIGLVIGSWARPLVIEHPDIAHIHIVDGWMRHNRAPISKWRKLRQYLATRREALREIQAVGYDCGIDTYFYGEHSQVLLWQARIPLRIAYDRMGFPALLTHSVPWRDQDQHVANYHLALCRFLPGRWPQQITRYSLPAPSADVALRVAERLATVGMSPQGFVVLHPGTGASNREWPEAHWKALIGALSAEGYHIIVTGAGNRECQMAARLASGHASVINLAGQMTFPEFRALLAQARAVVGVESLAIHLAAASGVPTLALWSGITRPAQWAPLGDNVTLLRLGMPCAPCLRPTGCVTMACVRDIGVDTVVAAVRKVCGDPAHRGTEPKKNAGRQGSVFIHSLFRASSTYVFSAFRRVEGQPFWCYQEPLHEGLPRLAANGHLRADTESQDVVANLRHPPLAHGHNFEFGVAQADIAALFEKGFSYDDFFLSVRGVADGLIRYLTTLQNVAPGRPVFQLCRSVGRVEFIKHHMGGSHILLIRNPRDQWWSYQIAPYFDVTSLLIANARNAPNFVRNTAISWGFQNYHKSCIEKEMAYFSRRTFPAQGRYELFFALWCYQVLETQRHIDCTIDLDRATADPAYRTRCEDDLRALCGDLTLMDCDTPRRTISPAEQALFTDAEARVLARIQDDGYGDQEVASIRRRLAEQDMPLALSADRALAVERYMLLTQRDHAIRAAEAIRGSRFWQATYPLRVSVDALKQGMIRLRRVRRPRTDLHHGVLQESADSITRNRG